MIVEKILNHDSIEEVMLFDFKHSRLYEARRIEDRIRTVALGVSHDNLYNIDVILIDAVGTPYSQIDDAFVEAAHDLGFAVFAYTVNNREEMVRLMNLGVDGIITDYPDVAMEIVRPTGEALHPT